MVSARLFFYQRLSSKNGQSPAADQSVESSPFWALGNPGFQYCVAELLKHDFLMAAGTQDNATAARVFFPGCFYYFCGFNTTFVSWLCCEGYHSKAWMWILSGLHTQVAYDKLACPEQMWLLSLTAVPTTEIWWYDQYYLRNTDTT